METNRAPGAGRGQPNINTEELWGVLSLWASWNIFASRARLPVSDGRSRARGGSWGQLWPEDSTSSSGRRRPMIRRVPECETCMSCDLAVIPSRATIQVGRMTCASVCACPSALGLTGTEMQLELSVGDKRDSVGLYLPT